MAPAKNIKYITMKVSIATASLLFVIHAYEVPVGNMIQATLEWVTSKVLA